MFHPYLQLVIHSEIPFWTYFQRSSDEKKQIFQFTKKFLHLLHNLDKQHTPVPVQLALSPTYFELLEHPSFQEEMTNYLRIEKHQDYEAYNLWIKTESQLNRYLETLCNKEKIQLVATASTSALLPYVMTKKGLEIQVQGGIQIIEKYFSKRPTAFWFPNGMYATGLDLYLANCHFTHSFIDESAITFADPTPENLGDGPVNSPHHLTFFPIHSSLSQLIKENPSQGLLEVRKNADKIKENSKSAVLTLSFEFEEYFKHMDQFLKELAYLVDENYYYPFFAESFLAKEKALLEQVHICSTVNANQFSQVMECSVDYWSECYFIEKELESLSEGYVDSNSQSILIGLYKEWMLLTGTLRFPELRHLAEDHLFAYRKMKESFIKTEKRNWLEEREQQYPFPNVLLDRKGYIPLINGRNRILILSWEFPPNVVGGLSRHVHGLSKSLLKLGYEIHVITTKTDDLPKLENGEGLHIHRVHPLNENDHDFISWIGGLNLAMTERASELSKEYSFSLIHAHDWLVGAAGLILKEQLELPLIATIHATEHGRHGGIYNDMQKFIHEKERLLITGADSVIVCSEFMKEELDQVFGSSYQSISIIPNGIGGQQTSAFENDILKTLPFDPSRKLIFSIGRMVKEKGFDTLLDAAEKMKFLYSDVYMIIAGKGPLLQQYRDQVRERNLTNDVFFVGYISDHQRSALLANCYMTVFPSRYEPFGIVALESMIFRKPTIVSKTGGLKGIIQPRKTGLYMEPGDVDSLIEQACFLLENPIDAAKIGNNGKKVVENLFRWSRVAEETKRVYEEVVLHQKM
jgi:glycosyltransferase involved in cell wall biosynthesis